MSSTGEQRIVLGTCHHDCPDSCGWEVTVENGRAVRMRGNPAHPYSRGELCPKVNRFLDRVYSPERVLTPLIRDGDKGEGRFRPASWDEALSTVAARLHEIIERHGGEAVLPWGDAGTQGLIQMNALDRRFFARIGSSRQVDSLCGGAARVATQTALGSPLTADPTDVRHSRFVLLWGTNTRLTNRHLWPFVEEARAKGATVVVIDPLRTITAEAADWFVQPLPGTDVALMLGMMHVIVRDDLVDHDYVSRHTNGFDRLAAHVLANWSPERAAEVCGLDVETVETLARRYASERPAMIRTLIGAEHRENGSMFFRTLSCLPALIGSWRERGGGFSRSVGSWFGDFVDDSTFDVPRLDGGRPRRGVSMNHLGRALTSLEPPVKALFVYNGNPLATAPEAGLIRDGLARDDLFTVVSEQFVTDTARWADVVFPACTQIEQDDVVPAWGHLHLGWNHRAIEPLGESVPNTELWRRLARSMGFDEPELFESDESLLGNALKGLDVETLRRDAVIRLPLPEDLRPYADGGFGTPDGRCDLWSEQLERSGFGGLPEYVPALEGPHGDPDLRQRFPLSLMSPKFHQRFLNTSYSHLEGHAGPEGEIRCEIHPDDAAIRGIVDDTWVEVFNDRGSLRVRARVSADRVRPGLVSVPFGWVGSRTSDGRSVNDLTNAGTTGWAGGAAFYDTLVQVRPAT